VVAEGCVEEVLMGRLVGREVARALVVAREEDGGWGRGRGRETLAAP